MFSYPNRPKKPFGLLGSISRRRRLPLLSIDLLLIVVIVLGGFPYATEAASGGGGGSSQQKNEQQQRNHPPATETEGAVGRTTISECIRTMYNTDGGGGVREREREKNNFLTRPKQLPRFNRLCVFIAQLHYKFGELCTKK